MTKVTVELGRETAEVLAGDRSAPGFYNAELVLAQRLRGVLSEEDQEPGHRLEITFGGEGLGPMLRLLHPATGCDPGEEGRPGTCWLDGWVENADEPEEMLRGKVMAPVTYKLDGDQPVFHLQQFPSAPSNPALDALRWAVRWIEECGEAPLTEEAEDYASFLAAKSLINREGREIDASLKRQDAFYRKQNDLERFGRCFKHVHEVRGRCPKCGEVSA